MQEHHRIKLIPLTLEMIQSIMIGPEDFYSRFGIILPTPYTEFPGSMENSINSLKANHSSSPFLSYAIISKDQATYIGQAGFFGPPDETGTVELGYEIARDFRGKGFANEVIELLIKTAFEVTEVKSIIAHTLNTRNASNHLLIKNNFIFDRAVESDEDGTIWRWVLTRKMYLFKQMFRYSCLLKKLDVFCA